VRAIVQTRAPRGVSARGCAPPIGRMNGMPVA
jgi:hypothetical protein